MKYVLFFFTALFTSCVIGNPLDENEEVDDTLEDIFTLPVPFANPANADEYFFNYRLANFAPDTEPLIKETFGELLRFEESGFWEHNSYTSHVVGFTTNLPALSVVEYGKTTSYGQKTTQTESYFYQHLHYIKGLEADSTYHYRIVARDYEGNLLTSRDYTFTLRKLTDDVIRIPEDMEGDAPYTLTQGNAKYVLTRDLTVPTLAINIKTNNVELDLDGHTIIYDDGPPKIVGTWWNAYAYNEEATFGIRAGLWNFVNFKVLNGIIRQGRNGGKGFIGCGFNPLFLNHMGNTYNEVAGITVDYYGDSVSGMVTADGHIHHNVLYDRGTVIDDRHMAIRAMTAGQNSGNDVSFNSLRRFRHRGIDSSGKTDHNELYSDSFETNSFALGAGNNAQLTNNKIFGMGYHPIGIGWGNNLDVKNNFIYMRGFAPTMRSEEYGRKSAIAGMRVTNYDGNPYEDMLFEDNTIVLKPEEGCTQARGIWTTNSVHDKDIVYRRNIVKVEALPGNLSNPEQGGQTEGANPTAYYNGEVNYALAAVTFSGSTVNREGEPIADPIIFEDNHLIGNVNLLIIGEGYGICNNVWMYRTKLEKIEHDSEFFRPVRLGFWYWDTWYNRMVDTECIGISENEMTPYFYGGTGKMEMRYGESKTLTVKDNRNGAPLANKHITLSTPDDDYTQTLRTDGSGKLTFDLLTVRHFKYGNSQEHGGVPGTPTRTNYRQYVFHVEGYSPYSISLTQLKGSTDIELSPA
ncbi:MAG: fibronectin type III domain-containing protein [Tannerellaceae bacterium]|jgi:hypothetical protein|nr:fibronectin type III domain-containing protein [Tannerellaceae bacterium]